jgi:hypothetical protein
MINLNLSHTQILVCNFCKIIRSIKAKLNKKQQIISLHFAE